MTITRYEAEWVGTDPKQLSAVIQASQGLCRVSLLNPMGDELVPRQFFGCTELATTYLSRPISQMTAGMGGMNVRVRIEECNNSPTEVEDCRNRINPGPIELRDSPLVDPMPGPMGPLMCSPRGMMLDTCTPACMTRLATLRGTRRGVVEACNVARAQQSTADDLGDAYLACLTVAGVLAFVGSQTANPFAAALFFALAIIFAVAAVVLAIAHSDAQALADRRWGELSTAENAWLASTRGTLTVCCIECVGDLLTPHPCPR